MTGEKKTTDHISRLHAKSGKKLLSKASKPGSSATSSPPKAAIAGLNSNRDEVHRRRNPLNDILRRRSGSDPSLDTAQFAVAQDAEPKTATKPSGWATGADVSMANRVAEFEKALNTAREEQKVLQEELENARRKSREDRDTNDELRWQSDHTRQHTSESPQAFAHERADTSNIGDSPAGAKGGIEALRTSTGPNDVYPGQDCDLRHKLAQLEHQLASRDAECRNHSDQPASNGNDEWNELRMRLHETEKESQERLQQLLSLKSSIASLTRIDSQVTDSELADSFTQMFNRIREWVISNFRRAKTDAGNLPVETIKALGSLTPAFESIEKTDRLALLQALVVDAFMLILEDPLIFGLPRVGSLSALRVFAGGLLSGSPEYREWRRVTIRAIEHSDMVNFLQQGKIEALHRIAGEISHVLFTLTSVCLSPAAHSALMSIMHTAADLQRAIVLQKACYQVLFFRNQEGRRPCAFDDRRMETLNHLDNMVDDDGDTGHEAHFMFCVSPCLEKFGDEVGNHLDVSNVLLKAQVCCGIPQI